MGPSRTAPQHASNSPSRSGSSTSWVVSLVGAALVMSALGLAISLVYPTAFGG